MASRDLPDIYALARGPNIRQIPPGHYMNAIMQQEALVKIKLSSCVHRQIQPVGRYTVSVRWSASMLR